MSVHTTVYLIAALGAATLFAVILAFAGRKSAVRKHLADLDGLNTATESEKRFSVLDRFFDDAKRSKLESRLAEGGWYDVTPLKMAIRAVGSAVGGALLGFAMLTALHHHEPIFLLLAGMFPICGLMAPNYLLNAAIKERKLEVQRELPNFLDMVSTTVEAGIALNGALATAVEATSGALSEELNMALSDIRMGRARGEALAAMAGRVQQTDLTTTVTAMIQSEKLGGNISKVLEELAIEARERRMLRAEEIAAQLPVIMVFPMTFFTLPALFVMIFGSVAADYFSR